MFDDKRISELRELFGQGMVSAVGEYTPDELWEALNEIERLRSALSRMMYMHELMMKKMGITYITPCK